MTIEAGKGAATFSTQEVLSAVGAVGVEVATASPKSQSTSPAQPNPGPPVKDAGKLNSLDPNFKPKADTVVNNMRQRGWRMRVIWGRRTMAENDALVKKGQASPNSKHLTGEAVDIINRDIGYSNNPNEAYYKDLGSVVRGEGLIWGGDWTSPWDPNHFEAP
jgi:hypothetical protein